MDEAALRALLAAPEAAVVAELARAKADEKHAAEKVHTLKSRDPLKISRRKGASSPHPTFLIPP